MHHGLCALVEHGWYYFITEVADDIGVGVHFNPFISYKDKMFKYGVVRMHDLVQDILMWERFYFSGRLQKPVDVIVDNLDIVNLNSVNLKSATAAALLLLPSNFSEEELYAKICSLSYMGDLRMIFAEDKNKVKKIVQGQFQLFRTMYKPILEEFAAQNLIRISSFANQKESIIQDHGLSSTSSLVSSLPPPIRSQMGIKLGVKELVTSKSGRGKVMISSKEEAANCMQKILRRKVMVSSARQAVAGLLTAGAINGFRYVGNKMQKAWKSWFC